ITAVRDWYPLAELGDAAAQAGLGFLFHKGLGVTQDDVEAAAWFEKAANRGQAEAQLLLGTLYFFGEGVQQSYAMAFAWCEIAQSNGQSDGIGPAVEPRWRARGIAGSGRYTAQGKESCSDLPNNPARKPMVAGDPASAKARCENVNTGGTGGSNPVPSSGESGANLSLAGIRLSRSRSRGF